MSCQFKRLQTQDFYSQGIFKRCRKWILLIYLQTRSSVQRLFTYSEVSCYRNYLLNNLLN